MDLAEPLECVYVVLLEDRHTDPHMEVFTTKAAAQDRFDRIVAMYAEMYPDVERDKDEDVLGKDWDESVTYRLSDEGDAISIEWLEINAEYEL